jgi:hypothetical protein
MLFMVKLREQSLEIIIIIVSRDNTVGITAGYGLAGRGVGVRVQVGARFFTFPRRPDRMWGPPDLLSNGYRCSFPGSKAAGA